MSKKRKHVITAMLYDKRGNVLSIGRNSYVKTHPFQARVAKQVGTPSKIYLHAEIDALVKCKDWTRIDRMVVVRYDNQGRPLLAKPCSVCERAIALAGIKKVEHS